MAGIPDGPMELTLRYEADCEGDDVPEGFAEALAALPTVLISPRGVSALDWSAMLGAHTAFVDAFGKMWGVPIRAYIGPEGEESQHVSDRVLDEEQLRKQMVALADALGVAPERVVVYTDAQEWSYVRVLVDAQPTPEEHACVNFSVALNNMELYALVNVMKAAASEREEDDD
ncbi:MAG: hypothetical protein ACOC7J_06435 [Armatimonadota bacterium]